MIVVTGGATGIGRAVAAHFAAEGCDVLITGRRVDVLEQTASDIGARSLQCDNADPADLVRLADACAEGVDVLVNNAGANTDIGAPAPDDLKSLADAWLANLRSNVLTAVLTTAALEVWLRDGGAVVNVGSIAAETGAGSYGAAKAAVSAWTADLAGRLGQRGITVNAVAPGYIEDTEFFGGGLNDDRREVLRQATALGRVGVPADIAGVVAHLASPSGRHVTGQTIHVNGGAHTTR